MKLSLPARASKPRKSGRTGVIDRGASIRQAEDLIAAAEPFVDLVKVGWGTAYVDINLREKIEMYRASDIEVCFGGTLFELAHLQGEVSAYESWLEDLGITSVEISDGTLAMEEAEKLEIIEQFAAKFRVYSEVGSKDAQAIVSPARWVKSIEAELGAGASYVILEGRESGTAGLYRPTGEIRMGLVDEILDAGLNPERLVFEAPSKEQQTYLLKLLGPDANLANIAFSDAVPLETLRLGLRSDTLIAVHRAD